MKSPLASLSIASLTTPQTSDNGDFAYRVLQPNTALGRTSGVTTVSMTNICIHRDRIVREADVLVIHMLCDHDLLPVIAQRRNNGKLTIFEISDNFTSFQKNNPNYEFYSDPVNRSCIMHLASICDAVQTTMPEIRRLFGYLNAEFAVFPNQISIAARPLHTRGDRLRVGWGGSAGHYEDIRAVAPALIEWIDSRDDVELAIMAASSITGLFEGLPPHKLVIQSPGSLTKYYDFVRTLDIGIAPALQEDFNRCRSDVKYLEYAAHGAVPLCSRIPPYEYSVKDGVTGFLFDTPDDMITILDNLSNTPETLASVSAAAQDYVFTRRSEASCAAARLDFYTSLIAGRHLSTGTSLDWIDTVPNAATRQPDSNHFLMNFTDFEALLYNGYIMQFCKGDRKNAAKMFRRASTLIPASYTPYFLLANCTEDTDESLRLFFKTVKMNPCACNASIAYAQILFSNGKSAEATQVLKDITASVPDFAPAHFLMATACIDCHDTAAAIDHVEAALSANPFHIPSIECAAAIFLTRGECVRSAQLIQNLLRIDPSNAKLPAATIETAKQLYKTRHLPEAVRLLETYISTFPTDIDAHFWLARTLDMQHDPHSSLHHWLAITRLDPQGRYSSIARTRLTQS